MPATIIMGAQWGDEGKGKLTDALAADADLVVRANGGSNAGHTVVTPAGTFKLHVIPSGILHEHCLSVIGAGVVIEPAALVAEIRGLSDRGINLAGLRISERAHLVLPFHPMLDALEEDRRGEQQIGTTRRGIGPAYADKVSRTGLRIAELIDPAALQVRLRAEIDRANIMLSRLYDAPEVDFERTLAELTEMAGAIRPYVVASEVIVQDALAAGKSVLVECAQATMLDIDYGTYPFVTSSSPTAAGACQGAGIGPTQIDRVLAVYKAYATRVGAGPMPTELEDATGDMIRARGNEYGTTTGRPRRVGWFDGIAARYAARLNGVTDVALTLVDVFDTLPEVMVSTGYTLDGATIGAPPALESRFARVEPVYRRLLGWQQDITGARTWRELPEATQAYIAAAQDLIGVPVRHVGVGPAREQLIDRPA